jgi:hypothetical protein
LVRSFESLCFFFFVFVDRTTKGAFSLCISFYTLPCAVISSAGINDPESDPRAMDGQYTWRLAVEGKTSQTKKGGTSKSKKKGFG